MQNFPRWLDWASTLTLLVTLALFVVALFEKGLTHEILLETGVFLVSLKLVLAAYKQELSMRTLDQKLDRLLKNRDK